MFALVSAGCWLTAACAAVADACAARMFALVVRWLLASASRSWVTRSRLESSPPPMIGAPKIHSASAAAAASAAVATARHRFALIQFITRPSGIVRARAGGARSGR